MSSYDQQQSQETQDQRDKGEKSFLSQQERENVKRLLAFPEEFPPEFGTWLLDYLGTAATIQKYQVQGLPLLNSQVGDALTGLSVIGTTYSTAYSGDEENVSNAVTNPVVSVPKGTYFCIGTAQAQVRDGAGNVDMNLWNSQTGDFGSHATWVGQTVPSDISSLICIGSISLTADSTIQFHITRGGSGGRYLEQRFLIAMRTA